jgi:hypothetical protein
MSYTVETEHYRPSYIHDNAFIDSRETITSDQKPAFRLHGISIWCLLVVHICQRQPVEIFLAATLSLAALPSTTPPTLVTLVTSLLCLYWRFAFESAVAAVWKARRYGDRSTSKAMCLGPGLSLELISRMDVGLDWQACPLMKKTRWRRSRHEQTTASFLAAMPAWRVLVWSLRT